MYSAIVLIPKDRTELVRKFSILLADAIAEELTHEELGYLISEFDRREGIKDTK
ncbi:hypothetical protein ACJDU8_23030 [Clostridium sp. WILCCON 0269]|uniref:PTS EIIA type-2 domain-containing protein n=1 Tax=Candidatus Clostridium eludens TaxID=3381663 RepID=A0ABW8SRI8_9CLOT